MWRGVAALRTDVSEERRLHHKGEKNQQAWNKIR
jgi:hypothetical protein